MSEILQFLLVFIIALGIGVFLGKIIFSSSTNAEKAIAHEKINSLDAIIVNLKNQFESEKASFEKS